MSRNLVVRIAFAVPAIAVTLVALWLGAWVLATLVAALAVLGTREIYDLARKRGVEPLETLGLAAAAAIPFGTFWVKDFAAWEPVLYGAAVWLLVVLAAAVRADRKRTRLNSSHVRLSYAGFLF